MTFDVLIWASAEYCIESDAPPYWFHVEYGCGCCASGAREASVNAATTAAPASKPRAARAIECMSSPVGAHFTGKGLGNAMKRKTRVLVFRYFLRSAAV